MFLFINLALIDWYYCSSQQKIDLHRFWTLTHPCIFWHLVAHPRTRTHIFERKNIFIWSKFWSHLCHRIMCIRNACRVLVIFPQRLHDWEIPVMWFASTWFLILTHCPSLPHTVHTAALEPSEARLTSLLIIIDFTCSSKSSKFTFTVLQDKPTSPSKGGSVVWSKSFNFWCFCLGVMIFSFFVPFMMFRSVVKNIVLFLFSWLSFKPFQSQFIGQRKECGQVFFKNICLPKI